MALYRNGIPGPWQKPPYFLTAYEIAVKHGFQGTEEEWLQSLTVWSLAKEAGFAGTFEEWVALISNPSSGGGGGDVTEEDEDGNTHVSGGGDTIVNVGTPENDTDAANKEYVDTTVEKVVVEKVTEKVIYVETTESGDKVEHLTGGNQTIVNVGTPENDTDAANKEYVDRVVVEKVTEKVIYVETKEDGTKEEHLSGGGTTIVQVAAPVENTDAANKAYVDAQDSQRVSKAGDSMNGPLNMGGNAIQNVAPPTADTDAVNKAYADSIGTARDVLYVNSSTNAFAQQTIDCAAEGYDEIHMEFVSVVSGVGTIRKTVLTKYHTSLNMVQETYSNGTTAVTAFRGVQMSAGKIQFSDCGVYDGSLSANNGLLIPSQIVGIKYGGAGNASLPAAEEMMFG